MLPSSSESHDCRVLLLFYLNRLVLIPVVDIKIMKNGVLQIREFAVIETVGKRKDFHDASLTEMRCFVQILYHNNRYDDTIILK